MFSAFVITGRRAVSLPTGLKKATHLCLNFQASTSDPVDRSLTLLLGECLWTAWRSHKAPVHDETGLKGTLGEPSVATWDYAKL
jgi:hypothetical protein